MENIQINRYFELKQEQIIKIHELYNNSFDLVKMTKDNFVKKLFCNDFTKIYFFAEIHDKIIGYIVIVQNSILLLIVDEVYRKNGIGSMLLYKAEQEIKTKYEKINLVAPDYFFCGVPFDTKSNYCKWFEKRGFMYDWAPFDMIVDLVSFTHKIEDFPCAIKNIIIKKLENNNHEIMSCYNGANSVETGWGEYFLGNNVEAIIAVVNETVIGGVLVPSFSIFDESLKETGSFGAIWVLNEYQGKGVGMKLHLTSLLELKNRGYKTCHIGYTYLDTFYGRLGAKKYIDYWIGEKNIHDFFVTSRSLL